MAAAVEQQAHQPYANQERKRDSKSHGEVARCRNIGTCCRGPPKVGQNNSTHEARNKDQKQRPVGEGQSSYGQLECTERRCFPLDIHIPSPTCALTDGLEDNPRPFGVAALSGAPAQRGQAKKSPAAAHCAAHCYVRVSSRLKAKLSRPSC